MNKTQNFEFNLPSGNDYYYVEDFNENFRKIDQEIKPADAQLDETSTNPVQNKAVAEAVDAINSNLGGVKLGYTNDGQPGYKRDGADTVYPFKSITMLGVITVQPDSPATISAKSIWNYQSLTVNDFFPVVKSCGGAKEYADGYKPYMAFKYINPTYSYNALTGVFTVGGFGHKVEVATQETAYGTYTLHVYVMH